MAQAGLEGSSSVQPLDVNIADEALITIVGCEDCACPASAVTKVLGADALTAANAAPNVVAAAGMKVGGVTLSFFLTEAGKAS